MNISKKIVSYLRELSIVIIGILITLSITNTISNYTRQKELKGMLELVKVELEENLQYLNEVEEKWNGEQTVFSLLHQHLHNIEQIPEDTLRKYKYAPTNLYPFEYKSNSYEVLKSSIQVQYIKEKSLLPHLNNVYSKLHTIQGYLVRYSDQKTTALLPMIENTEVEELELWTNGNTYDYFRFPLKEKGFRRFIIVGKTVFPDTWDVFKSYKQDIEEALKEMTRYGY